MRRFSVTLEGVKSITITYLDDDSAPSSDDVDANIELANGDLVEFGFTPFSTNCPDEDDDGARNTDQRKRSSTRAARPRT